MLNLLKYFCYIYTALTFIPFAVLFTGIVIAAWEDRRDDDQSLSRNSLQSLSSLSRRLSETGFQRASEVPGPEQVTEGVTLPL